MVLYGVGAKKMLEAVTNNFKFSKLLANSRHRFVRLTN